jgi:predicted dienelactone hydrolase
MSDHAIGPPDAPLFRLGQWEEDAVPADGRFPLIALSHGTGGSAEIMAWLARGLAARGYIVAGVNHPGNNALDPPYTPEGFLVWWERARDLTVVIDNLLGDDEFGRRIDPARIGAAGFSLGGYTMIEIAGGRTDPRLFLAFCRSPVAEGCVDPPEFPSLFARWTELMASDLAFQRTISQASQSYHDPRVRAAFAIAPALGPAFIPESLRSITTPVAIVVGAEDRLAPVRSNARMFANVIPGATLTVLPDVGHYTFLAVCTDAGRKAQPQLCNADSRVDRGTIHQRIVDTAADFFDRTLN